MPVRTKKPALLTTPTTPTTSNSTRQSPSFDAIKKIKTHNLVLGIVLSLYIVLDVKEHPLWFAQFVDSGVGNLCIVLLAILLFIKTNPIIGILGCIVSYQIIRACSVITGTHGIKNYLPSEEQKMKDMVAFNSPIENTVSSSSQSSQQIQRAGLEQIHIAVSLEEEMVKTIPEKQPGDTLEPPSFKPVLDNNLGASVIKTE